MRLIRFDAIDAINDAIWELNLGIKRHQNDAIWELIALFSTNQIAGNTIDFKMNVINTNTPLSSAEAFNK